MRVSTLTAAAALAAFAASPAVAAITITDLGAPTSGALGILPDVVSGDEDFATVTNSGSGYTGGGTGRADPYVGTSLAGAGSYLAIGSEHGSGGSTTATYNIGGSFIEMLWGSPDSGTSGAGENALEITFDFGAGTTETVTGSDILSAFPSVNDGEDFVYVRLADDQGRGFSSFQLTQTGNPAFEYNISAVPLPGAAMLMLTGLAGVGAYVRRSRSAAAAA